jgi:hypothetical protein
VWRPSVRGDQRRGADNQGQSWEMHLDPRLGLRIDL